jgi:hypothetical protein
MNAFTEGEKKGGGAGTLGGVVGGSTMAAGVLLKQLSKVAPDLRTEGGLFGLFRGSEEDKKTIAAFVKVSKRMQAVAKSRAESNAFNLDLAKSGEQASLPQNIGRGGGGNTITSNVDIIQHINGDKGDVVDSAKEIIDANAKNDAELVRATLGN